MSTVLERQPSKGRLSGVAGEFLSGQSRKDYVVPGFKSQVFNLDVKPGGRRLNAQRTWNLNLEP